MFKRRLAAFVGRSVLLIVLTGFAFASPAIAQDVDADGDGLIDIGTLEQLDNIRHSLDGTSYKTSDSDPGDASGCPMTDHDGNAATDEIPQCHGYELTTDLDFDTNGDGRIDEDDGAISWGGGAGWEPIGTDSSPFAADFDGNQYTIANLFINRPSTDDVGLFGSAKVVIQRIAIKNLGLIGVNVAGGLRVGGLAGQAGTRSTGGTGDRFTVPLIATYVTGVVSGHGDLVGGLVGRCTCRMSANYTAVTVLSTSEFVGGLVGSSNETFLKASYAIATVSGDSSIGGLVGHTTLLLEGSYAVATILGQGSNVGGLAGIASSLGEIINSYFDATVSGLTHDTQGITTAELQTPTSYGTGTDIYANWNVDLDDDGTPDNPWHFGTSTQYPGLSFPQRGQNADEGCPTFQSDFITVEPVGDRCVHRPHPFGLVKADDSGASNADRITNNANPRITGLMIPESTIRIISTTDAMNEVEFTVGDNGVFAEMVTLKEGANEFAIYAQQPGQTAEYGPISMVTVRLDTMGVDAAALENYFTPNAMQRVDEERIAVSGLAVRSSDLSTVDVPRSNGDYDYSNRTRLYFSTKRFSIQYISNNTNTAGETLYETLSVGDVVCYANERVLEGEMGIVDGGAFSYPSCDLSDLADGAYSVQVAVTDIAGNGDDVFLESTRTIVLDTAPPNLEVFQNTGDGRISATVADANPQSAPIQYKVLPRAMANACTEARFSDSDLESYDPNPAEEADRFLPALAEEGAVYCFVSTDLAGNRAVFSSADAADLTDALRLKLRVFLESALP